MRALKALLKSRPLPSTAPLFATIYHPHLQVIDTHVRDDLKSVLSILNISLMGSIHSGVLELLLRLITISPSKISWHMAYGVAPLFGLTSRTPLRPLPSFLLLFLPLSLLIFSLSLVVLKISYVYILIFKYLILVLLCVY